MNVANGTDGGVEQSEAVCDIYNHMHVNLEKNDGFYTYKEGGVNKQALTNPSTK